MEREKTNPVRNHFSWVTIFGTVTQFGMEYSKAQTRTDKYNINYKLKIVCTGNGIQQDLFLGPSESVHKILLLKQNIIIIEE